MPVAGFAKLSLSSGEIAPVLHGRYDLSRYVTGLAICKNWIVYPQGGATRRPPTIFVREAYDHSRILPYAFDETDAYAIEIGDRKCRFFRNGGVVLDKNGNPYEVVLPYLSSELDGLWWTSSGDAIYLSHVNHPVKKLVRFDHDDWRLSDADFKNGPFRDQNIDEAKTIQASATTGTSITLTATGFTFEANQVGALFQLRERDKSAPGKWVGNATVAGGHRARANDRIYEVVSGTNTGPNAPNHEEGEESAGETYVTWLYIHSGFGVVRITSVAGDGLTATAEVLTALPDDVVSGPTFKWAEGAFSKFRGYPAIISFHEQRLVLARTLNDPTTQWFSVSADYENMLAGTDPDLAMTWRFGGGETQRVNAIQWVVTGKVQSVGTAGDEFYVRASNLNEGLTPENIKANPSTGEGSAAIMPIKVGTSVLYVAKDRRRILEYTYDFQIDDFVSNDLTATASHLTAPAIKRIAWNRDPHRVIWTLLEDGSLRGLTFFKEHEILAWHQHDLGGAVEDLAVIPDADGQYDEAWIIVRRMINGNEKRYLERMPRGFDRDVHLDPADVIHLDCQVTYEGAATDLLTGADFLEGETIGAVLDGSEVEGLTVKNGDVQLPYEVVKATIGKPYRSHMRLLAVAGEFQDGPIEGRLRNPKRLDLRYRGTAGVLVGDINDFDNMEDVIDEGEDTFDTAPQFREGVYNVDIPGEWSLEDTLDIVVDSPFAAEIRSATKVANVS